MSGVICQSCQIEVAQWTGTCPACGGKESISVTTQADPMMGRLIGGKYVIQRQLGQGGMGTVYLGLRSGLEHQVAIKVLRLEYSNHPEIARRFLNEAKSYAKLSHPNAVGLLDFGQEPDGLLFVVLEYVPGIDLRQLIEKKGRIPPSEAVDIIRQLTDVLSVAHNKGIVHRDLKPENVMLVGGQRGFHVKVLDFGIARLAEQSTQLTAQGALAGTPKYMAPEQVEGNAVDARIDIYSLGLILFEMVSGSHPFEAASMAQTLRNQLLKPLPRLASLTPPIDAEALDAVLQTACAKRAAERYSTMLEFDVQLSKCLQTRVESADTLVRGEQPLMLGKGALTEPHVPGQQWTPLPAASPSRHETQRHLNGPFGPLQLEDELTVARSSRGKWLVAGVLLLSLSAVAGVTWWVKQADARRHAPTSEVRPSVSGGEEPVVSPKPVEPMVEPSGKPPAAGSTGTGGANLAVELQLEKDKKNLADAENAFEVGNLATARDTAELVSSTEPLYKKRAGELLAKVLQFEADKQSFDRLMAERKCKDAKSRALELSKMNAYFRKLPSVASTCGRDGLPDSLD